MSKIVLVCLRAPTPPRMEATRHHLERFLESLRPDNLVNAPTAIADDGRGLFVGIFNPVAGALHECSAYAGWLMDGRERWWEPRTTVPEGSFALFRSDDERIEVFADYAGSRTIWIAKTDELFVASMSQRAIPWFLGSFEPNPRAITWMLSSGSLGAGQSWDRRAQPLGPGGSARLDRRTWKLELDNPPATFRIDPVTDVVHTSRMRTALHETFAALDLDRSKWVLPLSGGHDSRAILLLMQAREGLKCITWGLRESLSMPGTDAFIARKVADFLGLSHQYFETDLTDLPADRILERFLVAGEGRVDKISAYMDGFELWGSLFVGGTVGIIRGDHGFGHRVISNADEARLRVGLTLWSDLRDVPTLAALNLQHLGPQLLPPALEQQPAESASTWRDRLFHAFRIPSVYGALNELKSPYVEIVSPLFVRRIVELARSHPGNLRTGKRLWRDLAAEVSIPVGYADAHATANLDEALGHPSIMEVLLDEISSNRTHEILSSDFASFVARRLLQPSNPRRGSSRYAALKRVVKNVLPKQLTASLVRGPDWRTLSAKRLALRVFLISRMTERLQRDAQAIH